MVATLGRREEVGVVVGVNISVKRGIKKSAVNTAMLIPALGIQGDAHAGDWHRQVSLLAQESIDKMRALGLDVDSGDFAENVTTSGIDVPSLRVGDRVMLGDVQLEVTQIGKECHSRCAIYRQAGDCVMPREAFSPEFSRAARYEQESLSGCRADSTSSRPPRRAAPKSHHRGDVVISPGRLPYCFLSACRRGPRLASR